ncbi:MAG: hypothetical protein JWO05_1359 [Gemmatimonadetes bacterium]|nr:hypothetical protein [Gemmatimonadota bacterium]
MPTTDKRIDAYIAKARPFARPILEHLRAIVHETCPECEETLKWSMPHFMYQGMFAGMAAFKEHCTFGFWHGALIVGKDGKPQEAMGSFGRITSLDDLPPKRVIAGYVKQAMKLNEQGVKRVPAKAKDGPKPPIKVPPYFTAALGKDRKAKAAFAAFSPSHRREYLEWITEAKTDATRDKRMAQALAWIAEGKGRNWKYQK